MKRSSDGNGRRKAAVARGKQSKRAGHRRGLSTTTQRDAVECPHCRFMHLKADPLSDGRKATDLDVQTGTLTITRSVICRACGAPFTWYDDRLPRRRFRGITPDSGFSARLPMNNGACGQSSTH